MHKHKRAIGAGLPIGGWKRLDAAARRLSNEGGSKKYFRLIALHDPRCIGGREAGSAILSDLAQQRLGWREIPGVVFVGLGDLGAGSKLN